MPEVKNKIILSFLIRIKIPDFFLPPRARIGERENEMKKQKTEDAVPFEKTEGEISEQKQGRRSCRLKTILRLFQKKTAVNMKGPFRDRSRKQGCSRGRTKEKFD